MTANPCPSCRQPRAAGQYLCRTCWFALSDTARRALNRRGPGAVRRLQQLYDAVRAGTPLADIRISD